MSNIFKEKVVIEKDKIQVGNKDADLEVKVSIPDLFLLQPIVALGKNIEKNTFGLLKKE